MRNGKISLGKRGLAMLLSIVLVLGMVPFGVFADTYNTVVVDEEDGLKIAENNSDGSTVITGSDMELNNPENNGTEDVWTVSFTVKAPDDMKRPARRAVRVLVPGASEEAALFAENGDDVAKVAELSVQLTKEQVKAAALDGDKLTFQWQIDWSGVKANEEFTAEQTITLELTPSTIKLMKGETQVYPETIAAGTVTAYVDGMTVKADDAYNVTVINEEALVLHYEEPDETVGRTVGGWWVGMRVTAPEGADPNATYRHNGEVRVFKDGNNFVNIWVRATNVKPSFEYDFDWNHDGYYEQKVTLCVDPKLTTWYCAVNATENIDDGGEIGDFETTVKADAKVTFDVTANEGYEIDSILVDGVAQELDSAVKHTVKAVASENLDIVVNYIEIVKFHVTIDGKGQVQVGGIIPAANGTITVHRVKDNTYELIADPDDNYRVTSIIVGGVEQLTEAPVNDKTVSEDLEITDGRREETVEVKFALNEYNVTVNVDGVKQEALTVTHGESALFTVPLAEGCEVKTVKVGETAVDWSIDDSNGCTVANITDDCEINVETGLKVYNLTAAENENVTVAFWQNDAEVTTAEHGSNVEVRVTVGADYEFEGILVNDSTESLAWTWNENGYYTATIEKVSGDTIVTVTGKVLQITLDAVTITPPLAVRGNIYIYAPGTEVSVTARDTSSYKTVAWGVYYSIGWGGSYSIVKKADNGVLKLNTDGQNKEITGDNYLIYGGYGSYSRIEVGGEPLRIMFDTAAPVLGQPSVKEYYGHEDVTITIKANDNENNTDDYTGVQSIAYMTSTTPFTAAPAADAEGWIECGVSVDGQTAVNEGSFTIPAEAEKEVYIMYKATDFAGITTVSAVNDQTHLVLNTQHPTIDVKMEDCNKIEGSDDGFYSAEKRIATVTVNDWDKTFSEEDVKFNVTGGAYDVAWEGQVATITFYGDAAFKWDISYTNLAGVELALINSNAADWNNFVLDTQAPVGTISVDENAGESFMDSLMTTITFGWFKSNNVSVSASWEDTNKFGDTTYYKAPISLLSDYATTKELCAYLKANENLFTATNAWSIEDGQAEEFFVIARTVDQAGNVGFTSTKGIIFDSDKPEINVGVVYDENKETANGSKENGYDANDDFNIVINVADNVIADSPYSGLKGITYEVYAEHYVSGHEKTIVRETTVESNAESYTQQQDQKEWDWLTTYTVDPIKIRAKDYNGYTIHVKVTVWDYAGNEISEEITDIGVNTKDPEITVDMDDEKRDAWAVENYYHYNRTATITIADSGLTWDDANVKLTVQRDGVEIQDYTITAWDKVMDGENPVVVDGRYQYRATLVFPEVDGKYTWSIDYENTAGSKADGVKVTEGENTFEFFQDTLKPSGTAAPEKDFWGDLLEFITFGVFTNENYDISITANADQSPLRVYAYRYTDERVPTGRELEDLFKGPENELLELVTLDDALSGTVTVEANSRVVVYFRITDAAGNFTYVSSDGVIVEKDASEITLDVIGDGGEDTIYGMDANDEVKVNFEVNDDVVEGNYYSGIASIAYETYINASIEKDENGTETITGTQVEAETIYTFNVENPTYEELEELLSGTIAAAKQTHNSSATLVRITTVDMAGNTAVADQWLDIDVTKPTVAIGETDDYYGYSDAGEYEEAVITFTFTERTNHFDAEAAKAAILASLAATNAAGEAITIDTDALVWGEWTTSSAAENANPNGDDDQHIITLTFPNDGNYTIDLSYTDKAGNVSDSVTAAFTVDHTAPEGSLTADAFCGQEEPRDSGSWTAQMAKGTDLLFKLWASKYMDISGTAKDATSDIASVEFARFNNITAALSDDVLAGASWVTLADVAANNAEFDVLTVATDAEFVIYLKITDKANNVTYINTDGLIVDCSLPVQENLAPTINITPLNGIYKSDVTVDVEVADPKVGETFSGLNSITYVVYNMGKETQTGTLYSFDTEGPLHGDLLQKWSSLNEGSNKLIVDAALNNSNDVLVEVTAVDNSGNVTVTQIPLMIDVTAPVIDVTYNGVQPDSEYTTFYNETRVATITITERNFNPEDVVVTLTNTDGVIPAVVGWTERAGSAANGDGTTWTATVTFEADGDYEFAVAFTDMAGNVAEPYGPVNFTIDQTAPVITVSYDNNRDNGGNGYFDAYRVATVTIIEHNFDRNRVNFQRTAALAGSGLELPQITWVDSGDRHVATIRYTYDGDFTFDVTANDMASNNSGAANYGSSVAGKAFTVDTTLVEPVIGGVETGKAYADEVIPTISFSDVNFAGYTLTLTRTNLDVIDEDVTKMFLDALAVSTTGISGVFDTFAKDPANDGIYTLTLSVVDDAGNTSEQVVVFTLNRYGSVYEFGEYLVELIENGYVTSVTDTISITEYNADRLLADSLVIEITRNGMSLGEIELDKAPVINDTVAVGESGWFEYLYNINASYFQEDGIYKISLSSKDATGNVSEAASIQFVVDSTLPQLTTVVGLEEPIINADQIDVTYSVFDSIGLASVQVYVNGELVDEITDFGVDVNNYTGTFNIGEQDFAQSVRIVITDLSGNVIDTDAEGFTTEYDFNRRVTVSDDWFVLWYANAPLFWGSIIGGIALIGFLLWFFLIFKRKKDDEEEENGEAQK